MEARCGCSGFWTGFWKGSQADDVLFEAAEAMFVRASSQRHSKRIVPQLHPARHPSVQRYILLSLLVICFERQQGR